jgi:hypothetical protein
VDVEDEVNVRYVEDEFNMSLTWVGTVNQVSSKFSEVSRMEGMMKGKWGGLGQWEGQCSINNKRLLTVHFDFLLSKCHDDDVFNEMGFGLVFPLFHQNRKSTRFSLSEIFTEPSSHPQVRPYYSSKSPKDLSRRRDCPDLTLTSLTNLKSLVDPVQFPQDSFFGNWTWEGLTTCALW